MTGPVDTVELRKALLAVNVEAAELWAGLREDEVSWSETPVKWSLALNLAHLRTTTAVFLPVVDETLDASRKGKLHSTGPFRLTRYGRLLVWWAEPPPVLKLPAPSPLRPQMLGSPAAELEHFLKSQREVYRRLEEAGGLDLTALRFASPLASFVRMNLLEFFCIFNAHARRHVWHMRKLRQALDSARLRV